MQRPAILVDVLPIRSGMQEGGVDLERRKQRRSFRRRCAIGAIDRNPQPCQIGRRSVSQPPNVSPPQFLVARNARNIRVGIRRRCLIPLQQRENFLFNRQFVRIRQLVAVAGKNLDPVIRPRIVRSRNHYPCIEPLRPRQKRNSRRSDHARAARIHSHRRQPLQESIGNPATGHPCVLPNHHARLNLGAHQIVTQRPPDPINIVARQRKFPRHATDPVCAKQLSGLRHESVVGLWSSVVWSFALHQPFRIRERLSTSACPIFSRFPNLP